jgi:alpha-beta hydrolase superfamily lysophospholipase
MDTLEFRFPSKADGLMIAATRWGDPVGAKGVIVISHGLGEHHRRYKRFAEALFEAGYLTYALDHRGHGDTIPQGEAPGDFGEAGWAGLIDDIITFMGIVREENPDLPLLLFGHSLGSFAAQQVAVRTSKDLVALVLSGSAAQDKLIEARMADAEKGASLSALADDTQRTPFDWLSRDEAEVDKYMDDPLCGFDLTPESLMSSFELAFKTGELDEIAKIRSDLPVLCVAGTDDPVNGQMEFLKVLEERWREAGLTRFDTQYYEGARHEILNETNRDEVTARVIEWMDGVV